MHEFVCVHAGGLGVGVFNLRGPTRLSIDIFHLAIHANHGAAYFNPVDICHF